MAKLSLSGLFLTGMTTYGPLTLGLAMLLGPLGVPLPTPLITLAAGAFVRQGSFNWISALLLGLSGALVGDGLGYAIGHLAKGWVKCHLSRSEAWQKASDRFSQNGGLAIYLTRFVLTPLAVPTNLIAGGSAFSYWRFLAYDVAGTLSFLLLFGGLGFAFGDQWQIISQALSRYIGWIAGVLVVGIGFYFLLRHLQRNHRPQPGWRPAS